MGRVKRLNIISLFTAYLVLATIGEPSWRTSCEKTIAVPKLESRHQDKKRRRREYKERTFLGGNGIEVLFEKLCNDCHVALEASNTLWQTNLPSVV